MGPSVPKDMECAPLWKSPLWKMQHMERAQTCPKWEVPLYGRCPIWERSLNGRFPIKKMPKMGSVHLCQVARTNGKWILRESIPPPYEKVLSAKNDFFVFRGKCLFKGGVLCGNCPLKEGFLT